MSEREQHHGGEFVAPKHETEQRHEQAEKPSHHGEHNEHQTPSIEHLSRSVEQHAISGKESSRGENSETKQHPLLVNKALKEMAYNRALTRARKRLSVPSRAFSKVVHAKAIEKPSEAIGKTIARPSGMLGGAFFALVGSSVLLWISRHYGYEYNYLEDVLLFGIGMGVGIAIEGIIRLIRQR